MHIIEEPTKTPAASVPGPGSLETKPGFSAIKFNTFPPRLPSSSKPQTKGAKGPRTSLEEPTKKPAASVPSPPSPKTKSVFSATKFSTFPPRRNRGARSALPQTPSYGAVEPLAPQLKKEVFHSAQLKTSKRSALNIDDVVDEQAIWMECSERLDHISDIAATEAWARILKERAERAVQEENRKAPKGQVLNPETIKRHPMQNQKGKITPESVRSVSSVQIIRTGTAEKVEIKRMKLTDVDCRSVAGGRDAPLRKHGAGNTAIPCRIPRPKSQQGQNGRQYPKRAEDISQRPNSATQDLNAAAARATHPQKKSNTPKQHSIAVSSARRPLNTPWEAAWHRNLPIPLQLDRASTPAEYSRAVSVLYSLSAAVSEAEDLETYGHSTDTLARLRHGVPAKRARLVETADGQRGSLEAVVEERFDSAMGMKGAARREGGKVKGNGRADGMEGVVAP
ncbi:hypothetical protein SLS60_009841 [Paraconiothyrium brasiliense]|uniref:Uncharacterized protein n=1 Tax=Paraconiothyrium brasiliense TaxID=300254 RepID=A0ABR3QSW2_9PLEO